MIENYFSMYMSSYNTYLCLLSDDTTYFNFNKLKK